MTVYVLVREDQSPYGFIDASIQGVFADTDVCETARLTEELTARAQGLLVEADDCPPGEWQVSWTVEKHELA